MAIKIALLGDPRRFIIKSIIKELAKSGYETDVFPQTKEGIHDLSNSPSNKIVILYTEDEYGDPNFLDKLKYFIDFVKARVFAIGSPDTFDLLRSIIPDSMITAHFTRPLNVQSLAEAIGLVANNDYSNESKTKRILIVDDDSTMLRTIKNLLSPKYKIYMASSGKDAISSLSKNKVDLILLDYEMPIMSGPKVMQILKSKNTTADIPIMFLTAKDDKESVMAAVSLKPVQYILKSLPASEILEKIDAFFEQ